MVSDGTIYQPTNRLGLVPTQEATLLWGGGIDVLADPDTPGRSISIGLSSTDVVDWRRGEAVDWGFPGSVFVGSKGEISYASALDFGQSLVIFASGMSGEQFEAVARSIPAVGDPRVFGHPEDNNPLGSELPNATRVASWIGTSADDVQLEITGGGHTGLMVGEYQTRIDHEDVGFCIADAVVNDVRDYALTLPRPRFLDEMDHVTVGGEGAERSQIVWWQRHRFFHLVANAGLEKATSLAAMIQKGVANS